MFFYDFISLSNRQVCLNIGFLFLLYPWFKELVSSGCSCLVNRADMLKINEVYAGVEKTRLS